MVLFDSHRIINLSNIQECFTPSSEQPKSYNSHSKDQWSCKILKIYQTHGRREQPGDGPAKLSTIPRIMDTQASRGVWGHAPQEIFENAQICYFQHIFTISMKDILYITLKVQAAQNVSIQHDLKNKQKIKKNKGHEHWGAPLVSHPVPGVYTFMVK